MYCIVYHTLRLYMYIKQILGNCYLWRKYALYIVDLYFIGDVYPFLGLICWNLATRCLAVTSGGGNRPVVLASATD